MQSDTDIDTNIDADISQDFDHGFNQDLHLDNGESVNFTPELDVSSSLATDAETSIETEGSGSLLVQIAGFCLVFGMCGFTLLLSIKPEKSVPGALFTDIDLGFGLVLFLGLFTFLISKSILQWLTKGTVNHVVGIQIGMDVIVLSELIDNLRQGRVIVETPDGGVKAMALSSDFNEVFVEGDRGYVKEIGFPLKIAHPISDKLNTFSKISSK